MRTILFVLFQHWYTIKVSWKSVLIEKTAGSMGERCAVCPDCGANRYTGKACYVIQESHSCDA